MDKNALKQLDNYNGTQAYTRLRPYSMVASDGAIALAEAGDCFWLLGEIAGAQILPQIRQDHSLQGLQFWTLTPNGKGAVLQCERDTDDVAWSKQIPFTDFPFDALPVVKIWVAPTTLREGNVMVASLPSEH